MKSVWLWLWVIGWLGGWLQPTHAAHCAWQIQSLHGVSTHFGFAGHGHDVTHAMKRLAAAGFNSVRDEIFWDHVESKNQTFQLPYQAKQWVQAALDQNLIPIIVLGYGHSNYDQGDKPRTPAALAGYLRYAAWVVGQFYPHVKHFEIWNEWDIAIGNTQAGTSKDWVTLLQAVQTHLRPQYPDLCLITGGVTAEALRHGWLQQALQQGAAVGYDAVAIHPYNWRFQGIASSPEGWFIELQKHIQQQPSITWLSTELGWPTTPPSLGHVGLTDRQQAGMALRMGLLAQVLPPTQHGGVWWYTWQEEPWGLIRADGSDKGLLLLQTTFKEKLKDTKLKQMRWQPLYGTEQTTHPYDQPFVVEQHYETAKKQLISVYWLGGSLWTQPYRELPRWAIHRHNPISGQLETIWVQSEPCWIEEATHQTSCVFSSP